MKGYQRITVRWLAVISGMLFTAVPAFTQIMNVGLKGGFNMSWTSSDDADFRKEYNTSPVPGFNAGAVFSFQLRDRYFLHTELLYATKGRIIEGDLALRDKVTYNYIEIPLMYQIHFKRTLGSKGTREFKWYVGIGPNFSYWLGGKGVVTHFEITDHDVPEIPYKLRFGERPPEEAGESSLVYIEDPNRIQVGINLGVGALVEPADNRKFMVNLRFEIGHSWLGKHADYIFPTTFPGDLDMRNLGLRLSVMYLLQTNLDKKIRHKGKSNVIQKGRTIRRKR